MRLTLMVMVAAVALSAGTDVSAQSTGSAAARTIVTFDEPGFPVIDVEGLTAFPEATQATSTDALANALLTARVLVWRHGSAFPIEAWRPLTAFLERGGSLLYLGGEPFSRPVAGPPGARVVQPRTVSFLKELRLNQAYREKTGEASVVPARGSGVSLPPRTTAQGTQVTILEPRLTDTKDFPDEDGSPGARDGIVRPLLHVSRAGDDPKFPFAAAAFAIDRLRGRWSGGRWVFWLLTEPPSSAEREFLVHEAAAPPVDFRVDPAYGTFHEGEQPSVVLRIHRPRAQARETWRVRLTVNGPNGGRRFQDVALEAGEHGSASVPLPGRWPPGLYRVTADAPGLRAARTGFWMFDPVLFSSGDALTFDHHTLRRNGLPEPLVGTTMMSATVHRDFLFEPDAATWDETFAELASIKVNVVRTGVWSGWKKIALEANTVDEGFLRALEAYYLTARRHRIPVIFTFFAFVPETFGGINPFFDPRAIEGQRAYVAAVAARFAGAKEMLWDYINEPSFSSPRKLWRTRPNGDPHERAAFLAWLEQRYSSAARPGESWQDIVRARWRLLPTDAIDLPADEDFDDRYLMGDKRPYRAVDYTLFAQHAFSNWVKTMTDAVRAGGSHAPVTVGQDEGGLTTRPSPLFHHPDVAYTSMHTWWNNDALLWDGVLAKASGKPLLVSETGIMQRELLSGEAVRDAGEFARLLSRKFGYAFAAGAFGVIQWCYDVNPYMASDNEVAIGLRRVDGSYKPEHQVLRRFAAFFAAHRDRLNGYVEPEVALIVPYSEMFSPRDTATPATRAAVRALFERLGIPARAVAEDNAGAELGSARAIVLPAVRGISNQAWDAIASSLEAGAHLAASGWFETDAVGLPAKRLGLERRPLNRVEGELRFEWVLPESWYAAVGEGATVIRKGSGAIHHHPLPLEWSGNIEAIAAHYRAAIAAAGVQPIMTIENTLPAGCTIRILPFRDSLLVVGVNESGGAQSVRLLLDGRGIDVTIPAGETELLLVDRRTGAGSSLRGSF